MSDNPEKRSNSMFENLARADFESAMQKGFWRTVFRWFNQRENKLLPFDEVRALLPFQGQYEVGLRQIPLDKIIGSVGRYNDFDRAFLPRQRHSKVRWINIDRAHLMDIDLPPIEVYKIGTVYFVKDGNHRVSVARERGQIDIDAHVIEIKTPIEINEHTNIDDLIKKSEWLYFLGKTNIEELRPGGMVELTVPGGAERLIEHISVHRYYMGLDNKQDVTWEKAVVGWFDDVYSPLVKIILDKQVLNDFPGRSASDLYLWIIEHLYYLREEMTNQNITPEEAAAHFTEEYSPRPFRWLMGWLERMAGIFTAGETPPDIKSKPDDEQEKDN